MTAGRPQPTSQPLVVWISDKCLARYVMYICFTANLLNLHPTLAFRRPSRRRTDSFEAANTMFMVTGPQSGKLGGRRSRFSEAWFAAWLCMSAEAGWAAAGTGSGCSASSHYISAGREVGKMERRINECESLEVSSGWETDRMMIILINGFLLKWYKDKTSLFDKCFLFAIIKGKRKNAKMKSCFLKT